MAVIACYVTPQNVIVHNKGGGVQFFAAGGYKHMTGPTNTSKCGGRGGPCL